MAGQFAGDAQQFLLQDSRLAGGDDERRGFADFLNRAGVLPQPFEFGQKYAQRLRARRHFCTADALNGLAESQSVSKGRRRCESFRQQQNFIDRFALGELFDRAPFVEQARSRSG